MSYTPTEPVGLRWILSETAEAWNGGNPLFPNDLINAEGTDTYPGGPHDTDTYTEARMFDRNMIPFAVLWTNGVDGCDAIPLWERPSGHYEGDQDRPDEDQLTSILLFIRARRVEGATAQGAFEATLKRYPGIIRRPA